MTQDFDTGIRPDELDPERPWPVQTPWGVFALYVVDGEPRAWEAFCPHMQGPLFQGSIADGIVTCPWHAWRYDLRTGERVDPEPAPGSEMRPLVGAGVRASASGTLVIDAPGGGRPGEPFAGRRGTT